MSDYLLNKIYDSLLANKLPKTESSFRSLSESYDAVYEQENDQQRIKNQDRIAFIIQKMKEHPEVINSIYKKLVVVDKSVPRGKKGAEYKEDTFETNPSYWLQKKLTNPEEDHLAAKGAYKRSLINALQASNADTDEVEAFLKSYGKVSYVNVDKLLQQGEQPVSNFLVGSGDVSQQLVIDIFRSVFPEKAGTRGPGEVALAVLSPDITFAAKGDLLVKGLPVEVKGQVAKGGGRLKDSRYSFGIPDLTNIYRQLPPGHEDLKLPSDIFTVSVKPGQRRTGASINILDHAQRLNQAAPGKNLGDMFMKEIMTKTYQFVDASEYDKRFKPVDKMSREEAFNAIAHMSFLNYKQELLNKKPEPFKHILFITPEKSLFFNLDNLDQYLNNFSFHSLDFKDKINGPAVQVSLK